jgi:hypothetical protein
MRQQDRPGLRSLPRKAPEIDTILSYPRVFGRQYWTVVCGVSIGPVLWRDALETFVRETCAKSGALSNEPTPVYAETSLAMFLRDAAKS